MADRGDVLDRVTDLLEDKSNVTRSRIEPWVSFVLSEMKQEGVLGPSATSTISLVAGTATYNLPAGIDYLEDVYVEDALTSPLKFLPGFQFDEFLADDDDHRGIPEFYTVPTRKIMGVTATIRLFPVPQAAATLRVNYKANFVDLDQDADVLELTDDAFTTAVWGVYRIWTRILEDGDQQLALAEFARSIRAAKWSQRGKPGSEALCVKYRDVGSY